MISYNIDNGRNICLNTKELISEIEALDLDSIATAIVVSKLKEISTDYGVSVVKVGIIFGELFKQERERNIYYDEYIKMAAMIYDNGNGKEPKPRTLNSPWDV